MVTSLWITAEGNEDVCRGLTPRAVCGWREQPDLCHQAGEGIRGVICVPQGVRKSVLCTKRSFFFLARPVSSC